MVEILKNGWLLEVSKVYNKQLFVSNESVNMVL